MATNMQWRRVGPLSGPANVLNGRYVVERDGSRWVVRDQQTGQTTPRYRNMKSARMVAERLATNMP